MNLNLKLSLPVVIVFFFIIQPLSKAQLVYTGIEKEKVQQVYAEQSNINWYWAASVQFVLNNYGAKVSQEDIIKRSFYTYDPYDSLPDFQANLSKIIWRLNRWIIYYHKKRFVIEAKLVNEVPEAKFLYDKLKAMQPVIFLAKDSVNNFTPYICTAVGFMPGYYGPVPKQFMIRSVIPSCQNENKDGSILWNVESLPNRVAKYCIISVKQKK